VVLYNVHDIKDAASGIIIYEVHKNVYLYNLLNLNNCVRVLNIYIIIKRNISNDETWGSLGEFCRDGYCIFISFILFLWYYVGRWLNLLEEGDVISLLKPSGNFTYHQV
jgi:hypothetical protein